MTLKEARQHVKAWPEKYRLRCAIMRGDDEDLPLFIFKLYYLADYSNKWVSIYSSHPTGLGRNINSLGIGEWLILND